MSTTKEVSLSRTHCCYWCGKTIKNEAFTENVSGRPVCRECGEEYLDPQKRWKRPTAGGIRNFCLTYKER